MMRRWFSTFSSFFDIHHHSQVLFFIILKFFDWFFFGEFEASFCQGRWSSDAAPSAWHEHQVVFHALRLFMMITYDSSRSFDYMILVLVLNLCIKRDRNGVTAYQLAKSRNYTAILKLFAKSKLILQVRKYCLKVGDKYKSCKRAQIQLCTETEIQLLRRTWKYN